MPCVEHEKGIVDPQLPGKGLDEEPPDIGCARVPVIELEEFIDVVPIGQDSPDALRLGDGASEPGPLLVPVDANDDGVLLADIEIRLAGDLARHHAQTAVLRCRRLSAQEAEAGRERDG